VNSVTLETTRAGVFAAGDVINGGATVVQAVAEGTRAARSMDRWARQKRTPTGA
jgi:NADPH-dependent glutamate synthase beta subunit-like oxidoreductase